MPQISPVERQLLKSFIARNTAVAPVDLDEGIGHFVRFLAGNDPTIARDRRELRVSDEREDCDAGNARSGTCGMGGPD